MMKGNIADLQKGFKDNGYHEYCFGGYEYVYSKEKLTDEEIKKHEQEAKETMDTIVDDLSNEIDKRILEEIENDFWVK